MDARKSTQFRIPVTFSNVAALQDQASGSQLPDILEASLARSRPTILQSCGSLTAHSDTSNTKEGVVLGCQDGTVYFLQHLQPSTPLGLPAPQISEPERPRSAKRLSKLSYPSSRSTSPSRSLLPLSPTFAVTPKPRVVSGVTTEQVEAPKNYVDFDDEPDKLKDILKGKQPREKQPNSDNTSDKAPRSSTPSVIEPVHASKRRSVAPRSLLSANNSRAPTPPSFSAPASPRDPYYDTHIPGRWTLSFHAIPSRSGFGNAVKSIQLLQEDRFFAVLQETGDLYVLSSSDGSCVASFHADDDAKKASAGVKERPRSRDVWIWSSLAVSYVEESVILVMTAANVGDACALVPDAEETASDASRCLILEFAAGPSSAKLSKLAEWELAGPSRGNGIYQELDGTFSFYFAGHDGHLITRKINLRTPSPGTMSVFSQQANDNNHHHGPHLSTLPIPNPFKSIMGRSTENLVLDESSNPAENTLKPSLAESHDMGSLLSDAVLWGLKARVLSNGKLWGLSWSQRELSLFEYSLGSFAILFQAEVRGLEDALWQSDDIYVLCFESHVEIYQIKFATADCDDVRLDLPNHTRSNPLHIRPNLIQTLPIGDHETISVGPGSVLVSQFSGDLQEQQIVSYPVSEGKCSSEVLWRAPNTQLASQVTLTSTLPLELELIIEGYSDGILRSFSLAQMARRLDIALAPSESSMKTSNPSLSGGLVGLHIVQNHRTKERYIVGGADDGSIAFWSFNTFELVMRWTIFVTPLAKVVQFDAETTGPLRGCALCISRDGTIAVIVVDGFHFLYLIPGSIAPLRRICVGGNNLLLIYGDRHARLWDAQTKELWRSFDEDKAEELLGQGGWNTLDIEKDSSLPKTLWARVADTSDGSDTAATLILNLERLIVEAVSVTKTISTSRNEVREILLTLDRLRLMLSVLLTPGLSNDVDSICYGKLGAYPSSVLVGFWSPGSSSLFRFNHQHDVWCLSSEVSASRALSILAVLRAMSLFEELTEGANTVISFYSSSLAACVGPKFKSPSLEYLGRLWFEASNELRQPIRTLFDATISNMSDEESINMAEKWQHYVPSLQPIAERESSNAALALFICGCIAFEKYSLLSTSALTDISKSISLYLNDENSVYRILAIDLCSRGFNVWQHYIDAMEILRSLVDLGTNARKDSISLQNISAQARLAVLSIASNNMPLLMGTLSLDILSPPSIEHQRSVLQILAFLIRKRPYVLYPHLPRLMEAVVKSLDPNATSNREQVLDTATEIIGYVVKTYPTIDFHMATQRLAVGTNEGAVIMYDVKTAIRLYVLEGHKKAITACGFSTDGRRLVTISLKESTVLVWKVGSSFTSFFNPGAPPRQGHGGSQPFKTLNFNVGSEADMTTEETLTLVRVEWIADRSVQVRIRQSILTFST